MIFSSAISDRGIVAQAVDRTVPRAMSKIAGHRADLAVVFATSHFEDDMGVIGARVADRTKARVMIACTAEGVIGEAHEVEHSPGISLLLGHLPGVWIQPFYVEPETLEAEGETGGSVALLDDLPGRPHLIVLLGDPFSIDILRLLELIGEELPGCPVTGGMASGAERRGQTALFLDGELYDEGAVGVALGGALAVSTVVSQGCRPIGRPFVVTRSERNVIRELGGKPALSVLVEVLESSPPEDRVLAQQGLFLGRAVDEYRESFGRGDFLVRNVVGVDRDSGAVAVGDAMRVGVTVQFHVRDAASAHEDLEVMLRRRAGKAVRGSGALLFSCNGRGTRMWPEPNHDIASLHAAVGPVPTAGCFCAGELGSIGGRNFIHGQTASIAIIGPCAS